MWTRCALRICTQMSVYLDSDDGVPPSLQRHWRERPDFSACVLCPWRNPHIRLQCGHKLCGSCVWHDSRRAVHGSVCRLDVCPACGHIVTLTIRLPPPTSGFRTLSLDGGGVGGIVLLKILQHIVTSLGFGLEPHQLFDFIVGTSTGSIVAATVGLKQWPLTKCLEQFRAVSSEVFPTRRWYRTFLSYAASVVTDRIYSNEPLIRNLKRIFGATALFHGYAADRAPRTDVKVVITATTTDSTPVTFSNHLDRGKDQVSETASRADEGVTVWESCVYLVNRSLPVLC